MVQVMEGIWSGRSVTIQVPASPFVKKGGDDDESHAPE